MRSITLAAGLLGFTGVALGAFGAHALKPMLSERGMLEAWHTGVLYHLVHATAVWAASNRADGADWVRRAAWCWTAGILLFSGSLYLLAVGGPRWLGPVTPLGGTALLLGWGFVTFGAVKRGVQAP